MVMPPGFPLGHRETVTEREIQIDLILRATSDLDFFGFLTHPTLVALDSYGGYDNNVIYAILHESIYCQG
jgi:hypothetical protein